MDALEKKYPFTKLEASSLAVGLPEGLMGNSEVGHLNIGAGRVVWQDVVRIDESIKNGKFGKTEGIVKSFQNAISKNGRLHLLGLVSDGGVHSHIKHLFELLKVAKEMKVPEVYIHFFGDGRDTDPKSSAMYMHQLLEFIGQQKYGQVATVVGRYYAMDRDKRWDRVKIALEGILVGKGEESSDPVKTINEKYEAKETDEFLKPIIVNGDKARIKQDDTLFFFNYRSDRVREITQILGVDQSPLPDVKIPTGLHITTMTRYNPQYTFPVAFAPQKMTDVLAEWLGKKNIKQRHIAETEKYAHVTFFFNGGVEKQFSGEERDMIPSPKVATYDQDPKMSVHGVADKVIERIAEKTYPFVMCNLAPPDMVGHTGVLDKTVIAVHETDAAIGAIHDACKKNGYTLFVTSDHGNAEKMLTDKGTPHTAHTTNLVPFVMASDERKLVSRTGVLGDVAPTILDFMGLDQPEDMDGHSLLA